MKNSNMRRHEHARHGATPSGSAFRTSPERDNHPGRCEERLPHRRLVLHALRQLARGHYLVVAGESSLAVRLAGVPDAAHLADDLIERGLVEPVAVPDLGFTCYAISVAGREVLQRGERWWRELGFLRRCIVHFTG